MYAFSENFILPLSHDEVVHGKQSLINKMPGDLWQKFANLRLLFTHLWCHPGKKLLFMGGEFAQFSEWYCKRSLDWHLLQENELHSQLVHFVKTINHVYRDNRALWENDFNNEGFRWLDFEDRDNCVISFARFAFDTDDHLVCVLNFTPQTLYNYRVGLVAQRDYEVILSSDSADFGGSNSQQQKIYAAIDEPLAQAPCHTLVTLPPLGGLLLKPVQTTK